jgi:hypothetical protein
MRNLFILLTWVWLVWLIGRFIKSQKRRGQASTPGRKKVDSVVIEKEKDSGCDDDKP